MRNPRSGPGEERKKTAVEEIERITNDIKMRVATVADALSDLEQARVLYKEGRKDEAFDYLVSIIELHVRMVDLRSGIAVFKDVVANDGTVYPAGEDALVREHLYRADLGPRPPRPMRVVPESPSKPNT